MHDLLCHTGIAYATMLEFVQCINQQFGDFAKEMNLKTNIMYLKTSIGAKFSTFLEQNGEGWWGCGSQNGPLNIINKNGMTFWHIENIISRKEHNNMCHFCYFHNC